MSGSAPPRVLIIMPHLGDGGAERVMLDLLIELRRQGMPVEMLVMQRQGPRVLEAAERGVRIDYGCGATQSLRLHGLRVLLKAVRAARRSDIVVAGLDGPTTGLALLAARLTRRPCIAMVHSNMTAVRGDDQRPGAIRWLMRKLSLTSRADYAVAVSEGAATVATREGVLAGRIRAIDNGLDIDRVLRLSEETSWPDYLKTVLTVGRLADQKGIDLLIRAHALATRKAPHRLLIVGEGPERSALEPLIRELEVAATVELRGFLANPYPVMASADLFCLPSRHEGLGMVLLESLVLRRPIVATDCESGPRTALDGGRFGDLVPTEDVDALANAIVAHFKNPARLREKAAGGEAWVRERFSIERAAREYIALFQEVADARRRARRRGARRR